MPNLGPRTFAGPSLQTPARSTPSLPPSVGTAADGLRRPGPSRGGGPFSGGGPSPLATPLPWSITPVMERQIPARECRHRRRTNPTCSIPDQQGAAAQVSSKPQRARIQVTQKCPSRAGTRDPARRPQPSLVAAPSSRHPAATGCSPVTLDLGRASGARRNPPVPDRQGTARARPSRRRDGRGAGPDPAGGSDPGPGAVKVDPHDPGDAPEVGVEGEQAGSSPPGDSGDQAVE